MDISPSVFHFFKPYMETTIYMYNTYTCWFPYTNKISYSLENHHLKSGKWVFPEMGVYSSSHPFRTIVFSRSQKLSSYWGYPHFPSWKPPNHDESSWTPSWKSIMNPYLPSWKSAINEKSVYENPYCPWRAGIPLCHHENHHENQPLNLHANFSHGYGNPPVIIFGGINHNGL